MGQPAPEMIGRWQAGHLECGIPCGVVPLVTCVVLVPGPLDWANPSSAIPCLTTSLAPDIQSPAGRISARMPEEASLVRYRTDIRQKKGTTHRQASLF